MTSTTGVATPTLDRVADHASAPAPTGRRCRARVAVAPARADDEPDADRDARAGSATPTATRSPTTTSGCRNGTPDRRAPRPPRSTSSQPGNGDRGDEVRVEVYATDGTRRRQRRRRRRRVTVANTAPTAGTVTVQPGHAGDQRRGQGGAERLRRHRRRRARPTATSGSATAPPIAGATARTLDLALAGQRRPRRPDRRRRHAPSTAAAAPSPAARGGQDDHRHERDAGRGHRRARAGLAEDQPDADGHAERASREPDGEALTYTLPVAAQRHGDRRRHRRDARPLAGRQRRPRRHDPRRGRSPPIRADARATPSPRTATVANTRAGGRAP